MRYLHYDVFTDRPFEGNQLAVFPDARGLSSQQMQTLAREMNFAESTFILPAETPGTDNRMRIFTPGSELPMAGHPTIGSTFALAHERVIAHGRDRFVFGLGVGPTPVELRWRSDGLDFAWMDQRPPEFRTPAVSRADVITAVGVDPAAVDRTGLPIEEVSCGVPFLFVPCATRPDVDAAEPNMSALRGLKSAFPSDHIGVFVFSTEPVDADVTAYSRMFAPGLGVAEDPATGGASGPLGAYLVNHGLVAPDRARDMVSLQGVAMGRPSRIFMTITSDAQGTITRVQVGGKAVRVGEGTIEI
ncbi:MAG: PhzF family phenazine biosynthesis protein [Vicinamibacterales bacterium]